MLAHFSNRETWMVLNQRLEEALQIDTPKSSVKIYQGLHHALMEVAMGLARQFPFKKTIYFWKGMDPYLESVAMALAREGYKVIALNSEQIEQPETWLGELTKETLMILLPEDDPLLGRIHPIQSLQEKFKDSRVFTVKFSHHAFRYRPWPQKLEKFQIEIYAVSKLLAVAFLGERARFGDWMSEGLSWTGDEVEKVMSFRPPKSLDQNKILDFEKQLQPGFKALFTNEPRLFDRSVFYAEDMDGLAVIESLAQKRATALMPPGEENRFETTSLSRWGGLRTMEWLKAFQLTPIQIRGLVILDHTLIEPELRAELVAIRNEVLKLQGS